jgi:putative component of membrane protein insertase Oxa1/YidC/SpoIIIJ protein YidD
MNQPAPGLGNSTHHRLGGSIHQMKEFKNSIMAIGRKWSILMVCCFILVACATSKSANRQALAIDPLSVLIRVYEGPLDHLSAVRRGQCPMHPSCLQYSKQAISKHGPILGWFMSTDRLMRCGRDEMKLSPRVFVNGTWKYHDPIENNDGWLNGGEVQASKKSL